VRVSYQELYDALLRVLLDLGLAPARARLCARLVADSSRDGVHSHGFNRFPRLVETIRRGVVDVNARPVRLAAHQALERWDGGAGLGNLNAYECMDRAISLCRDHGIAAVALANTGHWMRGGTYGWQAVEAGVIGICWTNSTACLPPWGLLTPRIGNNPLVVGIPRAAGPVVLDMALSQFSFGALAGYRARAEELPVPGGYDRAGRLSRDSAAIQASGRALPIGYWKGAGLALVLDILAALLSGGRATFQLPQDEGRNWTPSQVFVAIDYATLHGESAGSGIVDRILEHLLKPDTEGRSARYPGQRALEARRESLELGIAVEPSVWHHVLSL
jgi:3-dehydro-L-gulonate 2-dehydrogenase